MSKLIIVGDSHTLAYAEAFNETPDAYVSPLAGGLGIAKLFPCNTALKPFFERTPEGGLRLLRADAQEILAGLLERDQIIPHDPNVYLFSLGNTTIFLRAAFWKQYRPWRTLAEGARPLSDALIEQLSLDFFKYVIALFAELKAMGVVAAAVEAPPVRFDEPAVAEMGVETVLEITRLSRAALVKALEAMDVPVIRPPHESCEDGSFIGDQGLLKKELWTRDRSRDHHHANWKYGEMNLPRLLQIGAGLAR